MFYQCWRAGAGIQAFIEGTRAVNTPLERLSGAGSQAFLVFLEGAKAGNGKRNL